MPIYNEEKLYQQPPIKPGMEDALAKWSADWLEKLTILTQSHLESPQQKSTFVVRLNIHVGENATYEMKQQVLDSLKVIYLKMISSSSDTQASIAYKLYERALHCTSGFHDGVNSLVDSFEQPKSIDDLLYRIRHEIVSRTANQSTQDVHTNTRFFTLAEQKYGVKPVNSQDVYVGSLTNEAIEKKLKTAFQRDYRLFSILSAIKDQIGSELLNLGYIDSNSLKEAEIFKRCQDFLEILFRERPEIKQKHVLMEEIETCDKDYNRLVEPWFQQAINKIRRLSDLDDDACPDDFLTKAIRNEMDDLRETRKETCKRFEAQLSEHQDAALYLQKIQQDTVNFLKTNELQTLLSKKRNAVTQIPENPFIKEGVGYSFYIETCVAE